MSAGRWLRVDETAERIATGMFRNTSANTMIAAVEVMSHGPVLNAKT